MRCFCPPNCLQFLVATNHVKNVVGYDVYRMHKTKTMIK